ncbi:TonB-dependent receptor plug domain-containing protein [Pedobacter lithocola]|uniref:TonB-dependent receptor plug domain-containing protein n=1 Tax=Pedobacter lithocola TaxID=1908239 RepID=A0ABV8PG26_9SPHI
MKNIFFTIIIIVGIVSNNFAQQTPSTTKKAVSINAAKKPVYAVNGIIQDPKTEFSIASLNPETISEVVILKDENAVTLFGPEATFGAVVITTISGKGTAANKVLESKIAHLNNVSKLSNLFFTSKTDTTAIIKSNKDFGIAFRGINRPVNYNEVMYILDGNRIDKWEMDALDTKNIKAITVLKDKASIELYGPLASNGVILITTKPKPILKAIEKPVEKN